ncbi:helix-turn-helix transcriptional regulator [Eubacterium sp.]|uniref:helix-turn-helix transcriptional regulator n=1 Tax=Eubacterium sp. TaxID=142586 RepID=UPI002FC938F7
MSKPYTKLKSFMDENKITQRELAAVIGKTVGVVNQNLNGTKGDFTAGEVRKICLHYKISADKYFF